MKRGLKVLVCYICALLMISSSITAFAATEEEAVNEININPPAELGRME